MLVFAGLVLGDVCAMMRPRTGGITACIAAHLARSLGMILLLPRALDLGS